MRQRLDASSFETLLLMTRDGVSKDSPASGEFHSDHLPRFGCAGPSQIQRMVRVCANGGFGRSDRAGRLTGLGPGPAVYEQGTSISVRAGPH